MHTVRYAERIFDLRTYNCPAVQFCIQSFPQLITVNCACVSLIVTTVCSQRHPYLFFRVCFFLNVLKSLGGALSFAIDLSF